MMQAEPSPCSKKKRVCKMELLRALETRGSRAVPRRKLSFTYGGCSPPNRIEAEEYPKTSDVQLDLKYLWEDNWYQTEDLKAKGFVQLNHLFSGWTRRATRRAQSGEFTHLPPKPAGW